MNIKKEDLPVIMQAPGTVMRAAPDCGGSVYRAQLHV